MKEFKEGFFGFLGNVAAAILLLAVIAVIMLVVWPLLEGGYEELPAFLQIPFEILLDIFNPGEGMIASSGQKYNITGPGCLGVGVLLAIFLAIRILVPNNKEKGKGDE